MKSYNQFINETTIQNDLGIIKYDWKTDLEQEEFEGYLPDNVTNVLELKYIKVNIQGQGQGKKLFDQLKKTKEYKVADAVFIDPNPDQGDIQSTDLTYNNIMKKLNKIYKSWGFINNPKAERLWIFKDKSIKGKDIPT